MPAKSWFSKDERATRSGKPRDALSRRGNVGRNRARVPIAPIAPITPDGVAATRHREDDKCRLPWTWRGRNLVTAVKTHNAAPPRETVWQHPGR